MQAPYDFWLKATPTPATFRLHILWGTLAGGCALRLSFTITIRLLGQWRGRHRHMMLTSVRVSRYTRLRTPALPYLSYSSRAIEGDLHKDVCYGL